jgi:hypothetical protein
VNIRKVCFEFHYKFCVKNFSFQDEMGGYNINVHRCTRKVPDFLVIF